MEPEELDAAVERVLKRRERTSLDEKGRVWVDKASAAAERVVDDLVAEGRIRSDVRDDVIGVLVDEMYLTWQLKGDVGRRRCVSEAAAKDEYLAIRDGHGRLPARAGRRGAHPRSWGFGSARSDGQPDRITGQPHPS